MNSSRIERIAPRLKDQPYKLTSEETDRYNCIGWALHDVNQWWWFPNQYGYYWPPGIPDDNTRASVVKIFEQHGYRLCGDPSHERTFEKVALYEHPEFGIEHVARQLQTGAWTSKIGEWEDIEHADPAALDGVEYGIASVFLKRYRADWDPQSPT